MLSTTDSKWKKKRAYGERIREVQHGSFTPMVFSTRGSMGKEASVAIATLAAALAVKRKEHYSSVMRWLRCCLSFSLARSAIRCIRGSRAIRKGHRWSEVQPVALVAAEAEIGSL